MKFQNIKEKEKDVKASGKEKKKPTVGIYKGMKDKLARILFNNTCWEMTTERCLNISLRENYFKSGIPFPVKLLSGQNKNISYIQRLYPSYHISMHPF